MFRHSITAALGTAALSSVLVFGALVPASAQTEVEDSKRPLTYTAPTAAEKAKEPKQPASDGIKLEKYEVHTFDYMRINRPEAIVALRSRCAGGANAAKRAGPRGDAGAANRVAPIGHHERREHRA